MIKHKSQDAKPGDGDAVEVEQVVCANGSLWPPDPSAHWQTWPKPEQIPVPLVCCSCGVATPLEGATHGEVDGAWRRQYPPGRYCPDCKTPAGKVAPLIDPADPAAMTVLRALRHYSDMPHTHPWQPGAPQRWAHVDRGTVEDLIREARHRLAPRLHPSGRGCGGCGVAAAAEWTVRPGPRDAWPVCGQCVGLTIDVTGEAFEDAVAADAAGLSRPPALGFAADLNFLTYWRIHPDGGLGHAERFDYLGADLARLRTYAAQRWPIWVVGADWNAAVASMQRRPSPGQRGLRLDPL